MVFPRRALKLSIDFTYEPCYSLHMSGQPIHNSYLVVPGQFLAGEYPRDIDPVSSRAKMLSLQETGVTLFIDLTHKDDMLDPYTEFLTTARHMPFPVRDLSVPESPELIVAILDAIDQEISQGGVVYVHCLGGVGRTGVVTGCWLSRHGHPGEAALHRLRELWRECPKSFSRDSPETDEQIRYILNWNEKQ